MKMKIPKKIFILILFTIIINLFNPVNSQSVQNYKTISTRTSSVQQSCAGINREDLVNSDSQITSDIASFLRGYFGLDGSKIIKLSLAGDEEASNQQLKSNIAPIVFLILPFAIAGLIMVVLLPIMICCCCCRPYYFRSLKFWKRDDNYWSWKQLKIPAILGTILLLGIIVGCFFGFIQMSKLKTSIDHSYCSRAIVFDDILNGNVSSSGYFVGLQTFQNTIPSFLDQFQAINNSMANVNSNSDTIKYAKQYLGQTVTMLVNIPSGTGKRLNLAYPSPINADKTNGFIKSTFPVKLGSVAQPSSMIGITYADIQQANDAINTVSKISDYYMGLAGPSTNDIGQVQNDVEASIVSVYQVDTKLQSKMKQYQDTPYYLTVLAYVIFSFLLVFCIIALITNLCIACRNVLACRFVSYIAIGGLFVLGIMGLVVTIIYTIELPRTMFLCDFASSSASNSQNFKENFAPLMNDKKTLIGLSECVSSSNGAFLNTLAGDGLIKSMQALPKAVAAMQLVQADSRSKTILDNFASLEKEISNVVYAYTLDITDKPTIAILDKLSKSYEYTCYANGFHQDSWIPSLYQNPQVIPCKFGIGAVADHTTCAMGNDFQQRASGCVGCMDSSALFRYTDKKKDVLTALQNRYSSKYDCGAFNADLSNVWNNYYNIKKTAVGPVLDRYQAAKSKVEIGVQSLNRDISPLFASVIQKLQTSAPDFMHPKYGVGAGLSCSIVGQDMNVLSNNVCNRMLPQTYSIFVIFGVLSFGILFSLCFLTCSTTRHYDVQVQLQEDGQSNPSEQEEKGQKSKATKTQALSGSSRQILDERNLDKQNGHEFNSNDSQPKKDLRQNYQTYNDRWRYGRKRPG